MKVVDITQRRHRHQGAEERSGARREEALKDIYRKPPPWRSADRRRTRKALLKRLFFDPKNYDLGRVGRYKINQKLGIDVDLDERIVTEEDFVAAIEVSDQPAPRRRHAR